MKVLQINQNFNLGSTGKIMKEINETIENQGHEGFMLCAYANGNHPNLKILEHLPPTIASRKNILIQRITGLSGYTAWNQTKKAVKWIEKIAPDIIHIHNIHGDWINVGILFSSLNRLNIPIVWTLHDCWAFTGRCSYFENIGCYKWKTGCFNCPDLKVYPQTYFFDFTRKMWEEKKIWFTAPNQMHIVTPSQWLANYVKDSYLGKYNISVINNGISLESFSRKQSWSKYLPDKNKMIILGVASSWTSRKGLSDFIHLQSIIDRNRYQIVLVGLNTRQLHDLPEGVIGVGRTNSVEELAELYSNASVFVNPTYQDNYPTVNLEALACGTPVVTYRTGGSVESVTEKTGIIVDQGDINGLKNAIEKISNSNTYTPQECYEYANSHFRKENRYLEYIKLYEQIL